MNINLCFHGIGKLAHEREAGEARYWVAEELFITILDEARHWPHVRLSFDDGNKSDIEIALPALVERNLRAAFFPLAGRLDDPLSLDRSDLRQIRAAGMEVGSHGWSHIPWRHLSHQQLHRELVNARRTLSEASAGPIRTAALPLGRYDRRLLLQLKETGYETVYTSDRRPAGSGAWLSPRYSITSADTIESVRDIVTRRPGVAEVRSYAAGLVKRFR